MCIDFGNDFSLDDLDDDFSFEVATIMIKDSLLPYDIWVDEIGKNRNTQPDTPRLIVFDEEGNALSITISENPEVLAGDKSKFENLNIIFEYISENVTELLLHWNGDWDSLILLLYCHFIGKLGLTREEAYRKLRKDGIL